MAVNRGPEHGCGGPQEACCIPGCPECGHPAEESVDNLDAEAAKVVAHRVFNWDELCEEVELWKGRYEGLRDSADQLVKDHERLQEVSDTNVAAALRERDRAIEAEAEVKRLEEAAEKRDEWVADLQQRLVRWQNCVYRTRAKKSELWFELRVLKHKTSWEGLDEDKPENPPTNALMRLATRFQLEDDAEGMADVEALTEAISWLCRRCAAYRARLEGTN